MQSVPSANPQQPAPGTSGLHFLIEPEPWFRVFRRNLIDVFRAAPAQIWLTAKPAEYWADALVDRPAPWASIRKSLLGHIFAVVSVYWLTLLWLHQPHTLPQELPSSHPLEHYQLSEYLPAVHTTPEHQRPRPAVRRQAHKADPELAPQEIVAINENHSSIRQTIVNPVKPKLLAQDVPLPNIVAWTPVPSAAPVAPRRTLDQLPQAAPVVVPPTQQVVRRELNALQFPVTPQPVVAPASAPVNRNLSALTMPATPQAVVPPTPAIAQRNVGDLNLALDKPNVEAPKLPLPPQQAASGTAEPIAAAPSVAPPPPVVAGTGKAEGQAVGQLLALNVYPTAPSGAVNVPEGNRQGEFAAGPNGRPGASAQPETVAGEKNAPAGRPAGNSDIPADIYVAEPPRKVSSNAVVATNLPIPAPKPDVRTIPSRQEPEVPGSGKIENQVFGGRKYYTMALNLPNFTSSGGSWIMRFAELDPPPGTAGDGLSAPVAVNKVDPAYPATLIRERVEGMVVLRAVIHSDGSVGNVRILQSVNDSLDENAAMALQKWHFRPGTKNGAPVEIEAVIKIPFRAPRMAF